MVSPSPTEINIQRSTYSDQQMPPPRDYDTDPERYRLGMRVTAAYCAPGVNLQARIVEHLVAAGVTTVLDAGCGDGALACWGVARIVMGTPLTVLAALVVWAFRRSTKHLLTQA
jgi:hypothetical protein